ncbi:MAG TPA: hypothetical protein VJ302_30105 [Blastocatellia bacterium]|nr:hypothetical protein [Blastocatellia bacterium]
MDNPYPINVPREQVLQAVDEVLKTCRVSLNDEQSNPAEGKIVTKPMVFTRGVTTRNDLEYLATLPAGEVQNWLQGRYSLEISVLPIDQKRSQLFVVAHIEGRIAEMSGGDKWVEGHSNGRLEDEVIRGLGGKILGIDLSIKKSSLRPTRRLMNCEY